MLVLKVNGEERRVDLDGDMPLLWALRDHLDLTGTKYGCGIGACGACTVHLDGQPVRSCGLKLSDAVGHDITTVEGLAGEHATDPVAKAVQAAWRKLDVVQCGYCQSGQIMSAVGLLKQTPKPTDDDIDQAMNGNVCRCATYTRIRAAIHQAAASLEG